MISRATIGLLGLCLLAGCAMPQPAEAQENWEGDTVSIVDTRPTVAVIPFANYTGEPAAYTIVTLVEQEFWRNNFYVVRSPRVRRTLRQHRIRTAGMIDAENAHLVADRWNVDYLLLGTIDFYREDLVPEAAFSLRLLEISTMKIVWAKSVAATGADFTGLFGLGRITNMPALLRALVEESANGAGKTIREQRKQESWADLSGRLAIVVFDNQSSNRRGGEIVSSMLVSRLWRKGITVVEPGDVIQAFRGRNLQARGEIMQKVLTALREDHGVEFVLTGSVDEFQPGRASSSRSFPTALISARMVSTETGLVVASREKNGNGGDSELVLGLGAKRALGDLTAGILDDLLDDLLSDSRKAFASRR